MSSINDNMRIWITNLSDTIISIAIVQLTAACMVSAAMAMSCAIAYTMRYVRANVEGGVEMGFKAKDAKKIVLQTIKGAVELLQATGEHPESAIDKVTTLGGCTIKGQTPWSKKASPMPLSKVCWLARDKIKTTYNINAVRVQSLAAFFIANDVIGFNPNTFVQ